MMILTTHCDGSSNKIGLKRLPHNMVEINVRHTGADGYYKASGSWHDLLPVDDIQSQIDNLPRDTTKAWDNAGNELDLRTLVI